MQAGSLLLDSTHGMADCYRSMLAIGCGLGGKIKLTCDGDAGNKELDVTRHADNDDTGIERSQK